MNDKLAKYLRKTAKVIGKSQDLPERVLMQNKETGIIFNHPKSVRGVYRHLKKQARKYYNDGNVGRTQTAPSG